MKQHVKNTHTLRDGTEIGMVCIGEWIDLARYWEGSDGNAWATGNSRNSWVNKGPIAEFRQHFAARFRGELYQ